MLGDLVEVFLGLTQEFDMPAGSVVLMCLASHAANIRFAKYAADYFRASGAPSPGIPFLLGGTGNTAALTAVAAIEHWIKLTSCATDTISATMTVFVDSLTTGMDLHDQQIIIRLPTSQTNFDKARTSAQDSAT
jgi:hypothetical protein